MNITHSVQFHFDLALQRTTAVAFVRDVETSLSRASFLQDLECLTLENETRVRARIPVNAALFGQQELVFESRLVPTPHGARLEGVPLEHHHPGWAEVSGEATVKPTPEGCSVDYGFDITIHLHLPEPERWGGKALLKMIRFTAARVLQTITAEFPAAVQAAAREVEAAYAA